MKKIFLVLLALMPLAALAQWEYTYRPLLEEGKIWTYADFERATGKQFRHQYVLTGDTTINGESFKKLYEQCEYCSPERAYRAALREDGQRVFVVMADADTPQLLYDFSGEEREVKVLGKYTAKLGDADLMEIGGGLYKRFPSSLASGKWLEAVGSIHDLLDLPMASRVYRIFESVESAGGVITRADFWGVPVEGKGAEHDYHPLLKQGKEWYCESGNYVYGREVHYQLAGDTVIGGQQYMKLYKTYQSNFTCLGYHMREDETGNVLSDPVYECAMREADGRVYVAPRGKTVEYLYYDFSGTVGETMDISGCRQIFLGIDHEMSGDVLCKKYVQLELSESWNLAGQWIEGVGSVYGLLNPSYWTAVGGSHELLACYEDGQLIYQNPSWDGNTSTAISLQPAASPSSGTLYDLQGRRVSEKGKVNSEELPRGVYIQNGRKFVIK